MEFKWELSRRQKKKLILKGAFVGLVILKEDVSERWRRQRKTKHSFSRDDLNIRNVCVNGHINCWGLIRVDKKSLQRAFFLLLELFRKSMWSGFSFMAGHQVVAKKVKSMSNCQPRVYTFMCLYWNSSSVLIFPNSLYFHSLATRDKWHLFQFSDFFIILEEEKKNWFKVVA